VRLAQPRRELLVRDDGEDGDEVDVADVRFEVSGRQ
jgi:hypothetical protein